MYIYNVIYCGINILESITTTAMVSCSGFIWITNSSDHRRV